jgi:T5SS/PEP-CTERM-associated repeat protein
VGDLAWALQGGGTVTFGCSGTIPIPFTVILVQNTVLDGTGQSVTLRDVAGRRVLRVDPVVTVELRGITVTGSGGGGGILNFGTLTLISSTVSNSRPNPSFEFPAAGGGIHNQGTLTLINSIVSNNDGFSEGGGIFNFLSGTITLTSSSVSGNRASNGGGIFNRGGIVTLSNSTVSANRATNGLGGGLVNYTDTILIVTNSTVSGNSATSVGGGILNQFSSFMTVTNSTISGNSASSGGGIHNFGGLTLVNSTVSRNSATSFGGGLFNFSLGGVVLTSSIIAQQDQGANCYNEPGGNITSQGYNLDSDGTCNLTATGDIPNGVADLQPLAVNAPGTTATHALGPNSQARDAIPNETNGCGTAITTDQRGVTRPQGTNCDIGAYEDEATPPTIATSGDVEIAGICLVDPACLNVGITSVGDAEISDGTFTTDGIYVGKEVGSTGAVIVRGSETNVAVNGHPVPGIPVTNGLLVGEAGSGSLLVTDGAVVNVSGDNSTVANASGSEGTVTVNGAGSELKFSGGLTVGNGNPDFGGGGPANGTLNVTGGGWVGTPGINVGLVAGSTGTVIVDGNDSALSAEALSIGTSGGGTLNVTGGATLHTTYVTIGQEQGANGALRVSQGTMINDLVAGGLIVVGGAGVGRLDLRNGAQAVSAPDGSAVVGQAATGQGMVTVDTGSLWDAGAALVLGDAGRCNVSLSGTIRAGTITVGPKCNITGKGTLQGTVINNGGKIGKGILIVPIP